MATADPQELVLEHGGARVPTLVYLPEASGPRPAVVLATEAYGINRFTRDIASRLAAAGYVAVVPDYYRGHGLTHPDDYSDFTEVMNFIGELDFTHGAHDVLAAIKHARQRPEVDPEKVVVWGYCTGGTLAMLAASLDRDLAGAVLFFPSQPTFPELTPKTPVQPVDLLWNVACPVLLIYGDQDGIAPPEMIADFRRRFEQWGVDATITLYPGAGHAFNAHGSALYNEAADEQSWQDAVEFVTRQLQPGT